MCVRSNSELVFKDVDKIKKVLSNLPLFASYEDCVFLSESQRVDEVAHHSVKGAIQWVSNDTALVKLKQTHHPPSTSSCVVVIF